MIGSLFLLFLWIPLAAPLIVAPLKVSYSTIQKSVYPTTSLASSAALFSSIETFKEYVLSNRRDDEGYSMELEKVAALFAANIDELSATQVSLALKLLGNSNLTLDKLGSDVARSLETKLATLSFTTMSMKEYIELFIGLNQVKINWRKLEYNARFQLEIILERMLLLYLSNNELEQQVDLTKSMFRLLLLLGNIRLDYSKLGTSSQQLLRNSILKLVQVMNQDGYSLKGSINNVCNLVYALGLMGINYYKDINIDQEGLKFKVFIVKYLSRAPKNIQWKALLGLAKVGFKWNRADINTRKSIEKVIVTCFTQLNSDVGAMHSSSDTKQVVAMVACMHSMGITWASLDGTTQDTIESTLVTGLLATSSSSGSPAMSPIISSEFLLHLAEIGVNIDNFKQNKGASIRRHIVQELLRHHHTLRSWELIEYVSALTKLLFSYDDILQVKLLESIHTKKKLIGPTSTADLVLATGILLSRPSSNISEISTEYTQLLRDLAAKWIVKMKITDIAKLIRGLLMLSSSGLYHSHHPFDPHPDTIRFFAPEGLCESYMRVYDHSRVNRLFEPKEWNSSLTMEVGLDTVAATSLSKSLIVSSTIRRLQANFRSINSQQIIAFIKILHEHGINSQVLQIHRSTSQLIEARIVQILSALPSHQGMNGESDVSGVVADLFVGLLLLRGTWDNLQVESRMAIKRWLSQYSWSSRATSHKRQRVKDIRLLLATGMLRVPLSTTISSPNLYSHLTNLMKQVDTAEEYAALLLALGGAGFKWSDARSNDIRSSVLSKQYLLEDAAIASSDAQSADFLASIVTGLRTCNATYETLPEHYSRQLCLLTNRLIDEEWVVDGTVQVLITILQGLGDMNILPRVTAKVTLNIIKYFQQHMEYSSPLLPSAEYVPLLMNLPLLYTSDKSKKYSKVVGTVRCVTMELIVLKLVTSKSYVSGQQYSCVLDALHRAAVLTSPSYSYSDHLRSEVIDQFVVLLNNKKFSESELLRSLQSLADLSLTVEDFHQNRLGVSVQEIENSIHDITSVPTLPLFETTRVDSPLPIDVRGDMTLEDLRNTFNTLRPAALPNTLWLCYQLKYSAHAIRKSGLLALIDKSISEHISSWDANHVKLCMLLNALYKLHVPEKYLSESTKRALLGSLRRQVPSMNSRCIHNTLYFIAKLQYTCLDNADLHQSLKSSFIHKCKMMLLSSALTPSSEYPNALWGLANLAYYKPSLTTDEVTLILLSVVKCSNQFNPRDIATIFASFKSLKLSWDSVVASMVTDDILSIDEAVAPGVVLLNRIAASDHPSQLDTATLSLLLVSLGKIGCTVDAIPAMSRVTILRAINRALDHWETLSSKELYWIAVGLGSLGWDIQPDLSKDRVNNLVHAFNTHLSNPKLTANGFISLLGGVAGLKLDITTMNSSVSTVFKESLEAALTRILSTSVDSVDELVLILDRLRPVKITYDLLSSKLHSVLINKMVTMLCDMESFMPGSKSTRHERSLEALVDAYSALLMIVSDDLALYTVFQMSDKIRYNQRFLQHIASVKTSVEPALIPQNSHRRGTVGLFDVFDMRLFNIINTGVNPAGIIALLNSVKKLNLINKLPTSTPVLFAACSMIAATLDGRTFLKMLLVLTELKLKWTDLPPDQQVSIISGIARTISHKPNRLIALLPLLIELKVTYDDLHKSISLILRFVIFQLFNGKLVATDDEVSQEALLLVITNLNIIGARYHHLGEKAYRRLQEYVQDIKDPGKKQVFASILMEMSK